MFLCGRVPWIYGKQFEIVVFNTNDYFWGSCREKGGRRTFPVPLIALHKTNYRNTRCFVFVNGSCVLRKCWMIPMHCRTSEKMKINIQELPYNSHWNSSFRERDMRKQWEIQTNTTASEGLSGENVEKLKWCLKVTSITVKRVKALMCYVKIRSL